jgi:hypothetical protein
MEKIWAMLLRLRLYMRKMYRLRRLIEESKVVEMKETMVVKLYKDW